MNKFNWSRNFDLFCIAWVLASALVDATKENYHAALGWAFCGMYMGMHMHSQEERMKLQGRLNRALGKF